MKRWFKILFCSAALLMAGSALLAQHRVDKKRLWEGEKTERSYKRVKIFTYAPDAGTSGSSPAVIILPGGSYRYLAINQEGFDVAKSFAKRGYLAIVLRYRMGWFGAHYPDQLEDYRRAMAYLKDNSTALGIDTSKIAVVGFSAGGHLAGCAALEENPKYRPAYVAMLYPVVTLREPYCHRLSKKNLLRGDTTLIPKLSLDENVRKDMAPVFLLHCEDDPIVKSNGSHNMASELERKGVPCKVEFHQKGGHGFGVRAAKNSGARGWNDRFLKWIGTLQK